MEQPIKASPQRPQLYRSQTDHTSNSSPGKLNNAAGSTRRRVNPLNPLRPLHHTHRHRKHDDPPQTVTPLAGVKAGTTNTTPYTKSLQSNAQRVRRTVTGSTFHSLAEASSGYAAYRNTRPRVSLETVSRAHQKSQMLEQELRASLNDLSDVAHSATRRLDNTWYGILEKVNILRSTINSLQELFTAHTRLHDTFDHETKELERDIKGQIDSFDHFTKQQQTVDELERRVHVAMDEAAGLSDRLDNARRDVDSWERREAEWQARTTARLRILWSVLGCICVLVLLLLVLPLISSNFFPRTRAGEPTGPAVLSQDIEQVAAWLSIPDFAASILAEAKASKTSRPRPAQGEETDFGWVAGRESSKQADGLWKAFDEL